MSAKKKKDGEEKPFNENWEAEIAKFDKECSAHDVEYMKTHIVVDGSGSKKLTAEENEILTLFLSGTSCREIAAQNDIEEEVVTEILAIIRAKLSIED